MVSTPPQSPLHHPAWRPGYVGTTSTAWIRCSHVTWASSGTPVSGRVHNPGMLPESAESPDDPLEQDAPDHQVDDSAIGSWFLAEGDRANRATDLRMFTTGNLVKPLIDGRSYFGQLCAELEAARAGDQVYLLDFRGDLDERLDGPGSEVGEILGLAARRGVSVFGLLWRSHPKALRQSEEANAEFVRRIDDDGGQMLLDARTRRGGSHHQKLVVVRHPGAPERDVAFVGGIDLGYSRNDDSRHLGDPQVMTFPDAYGRRPPWHDIQAEVRGPAVHDLEHTFRERWYGSSVLDVPSPLRQLYDRAYHMGAMTSRPLPEPAPDDPTRRGPHAIQVLRTYPARLRRYPFAPHGERSIAHAYRKAFARARCLVYVEDQYLWSRPAADIIASALRDKPDLHVIAVVPRHPDNDGPITRMPGLLARHDVMRACTAAGGSRFAVYDLENHQGTPVYVHAKVVIVDDVWAMVGSDNLNRRSWSHDSELSIGVLDSELDAREPHDPAGLGDGARAFARELRLRLWREHLDRDAHDVADLLHPAEAFETFRRQAEQLAAWHETGRRGSRPPGRVSPHRCSNPTTAQRLWATPLYRIIYDPDGRPWHARLRGRLLPSVDRDCSRRHTRALPGSPVRHRAARSTGRCCSLTITAWRRGSGKINPRRNCWAGRAVTGTAILRLVCQFPYWCISAGHRQACPTSRCARSPLFNSSVSAPANRCLPGGPSSIRWRGQAAAVVLL
jgi:phosphatidylserine/phosphatidylglycerophosphate/cardiolipin synthase-like enzyme